MYAKETVWIKAAYKASSMHHNKILKTSPSLKHLYTFHVAFQEQKLCVRVPRTIP